MALSCSIIRRRSVSLVLVLLGVIASQGAPHVVSAQPSLAPRGMHTSNLGNIVNNYTTIDVPGFGDSPNAVVLVQPYDVQKHVGVFYDTGRRRWAVFNQDKTPMDAGKKFNVVIDGGFVHRATAENTASGWTRIDNPITNNAPMAVVFVTQRWNPNGANGGYNNRAVGVWYEPATKKWAIYNEDRSPMGIGLEFNVKVFATNGSGMPGVNIWRTGPGNGSSPTQLSPAQRLTGGGIFFMTHAYNPGGIGGTYFPHVVGIGRTPGGAVQMTAPPGVSVPNDLAFDVLTY
jgi:hypothetical protein